MALDPQVGCWVWHDRFKAACQIVEAQHLWGEVALRVWVPARDAIIRASSKDLSLLEDRTVARDQILHVVASARLQDAIEENLLLAPMQSSVVPLPHQLHALNKAMSRDKVRYLLADEVGLGKTIEAGLIWRELKLRGRVKRALVVAPKGLVRQWQAEMRTHFGETLHFIEGADLGAYRSQRGENESLWQQHDQVICSLDSVKPMDVRKGWSPTQLMAYNRERFEELVAAGWDLVIIDESHRLGGSTDQVARYKLGSALSESSPYLLLLSATPHQGKSDQFLRLIQLLDKDSFPDESSVSRERVHPFVIRTEKRQAVDAEGNPLFKPRATRLYPVAWLEHHGHQQSLYDAVTEYVRTGYNQALASKQRHIGFLMILMQRLVTSSTAAIRTTLERRLAQLEAPSAQTSFFDAIDPDDWEELDGQAQVELALQANGWVQEKTEVKTLLELAQATEAQGTDAKAEALLELIYKLQQEEADPALKVLVFTEFVPTQAMLSEFLEGRGFTVVQLNGSLDLDARSQVQAAFAKDVRILISTDAGGEGLNLQFCHVIVNFDMPWNPMRIEQRIGRVDRIGQPHVVRAINFVLQDTVEHRIREVLEQKLALIAQEFGVDKAADVMDSSDVEPLFDELFLKAIQQPESLDTQCEVVAQQVREKVQDTRSHNDLLSDTPNLEPTAARGWRDHPAQFWLERAITSGLTAAGGKATLLEDGWKVQWPDGSTSQRLCFDARTAAQYPEREWCTLEDPRARNLVQGISRWAQGQMLPSVHIDGLPETVRGVWSLWDVSLVCDGFGRKRFLPVFISQEGRSFQPTARRIWDLILTENVSDYVRGDVPSDWYNLSFNAAQSQGERIFSDLSHEHRLWVEAERARTEYAFAARIQMVGRLGLPAVREHRKKRLEQGKGKRMQLLEDASIALPGLHPILFLQVGAA
ncbi:MAG: DEAD/DEAH box helicase family protein [Fibrobacterota bacterium]|nr:MAG: DEAD/DEAH box helicase family protein [Fibrobacterota bacterium]